MSVVQSTAKRTRLLAESATELGVIWLSITVGYYLGGTSWWAGWDPVLFSLSVAITLIPSVLTLAAVKLSSRYLGVFGG